MQRYDLVELTYQVYYTDHEMEKYDEGEWVKHDDAAARLRELEADRDLMQQQADECIVASGSCGLLSADLPDYITGLKAERADRDRLAAIVERARNGDRAGGSATIWSLREQRDNGLVRIAELESEFGAARDKYVREGIERVVEASRSREGVRDDIVQRTCDDALAEFEKE